MTLISARARSPLEAAADRPSTRAIHPPLALSVLFVGLMFYAAFGKGFAWAGWPPVFVGEVMLAVLLASAVRPWAAIPRNAAAVVTAAVVIVATVQFAVDRLNAAHPLFETLRGLAPVYYAAFAFVVYALLRAYEQQAGRSVILATPERALVRATPWVVGVLALLAGRLLVAEPIGLPTWPSSGVSMAWSKSGDIAVALVLFAPVLLSRAAAERFGAYRLPLAALWFGAALVVTFRSRGALLAMVLGLIVMLPRPVRLAKAAMAVVTVLVVLYASGVSVQVSTREISFDALGDAVQSMIGDAPQSGSNLAATTRWRTEWWGGIWADVQEERMVLHGHGWGDNLAQRYGVISQGEADEPTALRLPHNIFFSLVGRAGLIVAIGFLLVPVLTILPTFRSGAGRRVAPAVMSARGAVAAAIGTGLADIYIESPQGGVLFWSLVGFLWWACARPAETDAELPVTPDSEGAEPPAMPRGEA